MDGSPFLQDYYAFYGFMKFVVLVFKTFETPYTSCLFHYYFTLLVRFICKSHALKHT
jgi:hypothetical protein